MASSDCTIFLNIHPVLGISISFITTTGLMIFPCVGSVPRPGFQNIHLLCRRCRQTLLEAPTAQPLKGTMKMYVSLDLGVPVLGIYPKSELPTKSFTMALFVMAED